MDDKRVDLQFVYDRLGEDRRSQAYFEVVHLHALLGALDGLGHEAVRDDLPLLGPHAVHHVGDAFPDLSRGLQNLTLGYRISMVKVYDDRGFKVYLYSPPREHHMKRVDARQAVRIVQEHQQRFLAEWRRINDQADPRP